MGPVQFPTVNIAGEPVDTVIDSRPALMSDFINSLREENRRIKEGKRMSQFTLALKHQHNSSRTSLMDKIRIASENRLRSHRTLERTTLTAYEEQNGSLADVKKSPSMDYGLPVTNCHRPTPVWLDTTGAEHQEALEESEAAYGTRPPPSDQPTAFASPPRGVADLQLGRDRNYRELLELGA